MKETFSHIENHLNESVEDLFSLLEKPSISATGEGISDNIDLIQTLCQIYGFDRTELVHTSGQPGIIAYAEADETLDDRPTVLLYGHYDVQPVNADEWATPPFEPTIREGSDGKDRIFARGAGDNKGQWFTHLCAIQSLRETTGLPVNVTLLLEGEEESGSPHLNELVKRQKEELEADLTYVADGPIDMSGSPHVLMGARGMCSVQIDVVGPNRDLHSGNYGGPVPNPARELKRLLSTMEEGGYITIDEFYDDVRNITDLDQEVLNAMPFDAENIKTDLDIDEFAEGPGDSYLEKLLYYPTFNIAGLTSGYGGEGMKTIIPSRAQAKVDMRLVADQDPAEIYDRLEKHVENYEANGVNIEISDLGTMTPQRTPLDHPIRKPVMEAVADGWNTEPILKPTLGGSLPTAVFADHLDTPVTIVPYANSDENNHSPNENLSIDCFHKGIRTTAALLSRIEDADLGNK